MSFELVSGLYVDNNYTLSDTDTTVYRSFSTTLSKGTYTLSASESVMMVKRIINGEFISENVALPYMFTVETESVVGVSIRTEPSADWNDNIYLEISKMTVTIAEKLTVIAENEQKVYDAGKQAQYDAFWDTFQNNGNRTYYVCAFCGAGWTEETFKPKYDLTPVGTCDNMFYTFGLAVPDGIRNPLMDLAQHLEDCGVRLDCSQMVRAYRSFYNARFSRLPELDFSNCTTLSQAFCYSPVETIDKLILGSKITDANLNGVFTYCDALKNIIIEGEIPLSIAFPSSPLTVDSMKSIISALKDYSETGETRTLTLHETAKARLSDAEIAIATQKGWTIA